MKSGDIVANRYRLSARIGAGSMGEVWRASHIVTGRDFALKLVHPHIAASAELRVHFAREARASAKIDHPSVVDILDVGELDGGGLYLVMDLLRGITLRDALHGEPRLSLPDFLSILLDTSRALVAAHAAGVVHRDLKPANIFLHRDRLTGLSSARVLDFGISKFLDEDAGATRTDAFFGSPRYMSPEQIRAPGKVDHRADLWSIGVILFEGLTGTFPHDAEGVAARLAAICGTPPRDIDELAPDLPEGLRSLVRDCLSPLEQRISSTRELAGRLESALSDPRLPWRSLPGPVEARSSQTAANEGLRLQPPLRSHGGPLSAMSAPSEPGGSTTAAATRSPPQAARRSSRLPLLLFAALFTTATVAVVWRSGAGAPETGEGASSASLPSPAPSSSTALPAVTPPHATTAKVPPPPVAPLAASTAAPHPSALPPLDARRLPPATPASPKPPAPPRVAPIQDRPTPPPAEKPHDPFSEM